MLWESLFLHPAWVFKEEVWGRRRDSGLGNHCGLPAGSPIAFSTFFAYSKLFATCEPPQCLRVHVGGVILPPLPQQSLLASLLWVPYQ